MTVFWSVGTGSVVTVVVGCASAVAGAAFCTNELGAGAGAPGEAP